MTIVTAKRIKHLSRYFGVLGLICFLGYWFTPYSYYFLPTLGPCFFLVYYLRYGGLPFVGIITHMLPNDATFNKIFLLFPVSILYFGLIGFHLKNILNERGKIRWIILLAFLGFLGYMHFLAFHELGLYWKGSSGLGPAAAKSKLTNPSPRVNVPLGDNQGEPQVVGSRQKHPL